MNSEDGQARGSPPLRRAAAAAEALYAENGRNRVYIGVDEIGGTGIGNLDPEVVARHQATSIMKSLRTTTSPQRLPRCSARRSARLSQ